MPDFDSQLSAFIESPTEEESVTTDTNQWRVVDEIPAVVTGPSQQEASTTTEPTIIRLSDPQEQEDGVQFRPRFDIPFVDDPSDQRIIFLPEGFQEKEIPEEDTTTIEPAVTESLQNKIDEEYERIRSHLSVHIHTGPRKEYDYQLLFTVATGTAFAFLFFFILIVLFRCYSWGGPNDKVIDQTPPILTKHIIYTIGNGTSYPTKIETVHS